MDPITEDPGALDNRLSLDPNDERWSGTLGEWEDGMEYDITLKVRQVSPGEFAVLSIAGAKGGGGYEGEEEVPESEEVAASEASYKQGDVNPAVQSLLAARQRG